MSLASSAFLSFLAVLGFRYEVTDNYLKLTNTYSCFWLLLFCFFVWAIYRALHEKDRALLVWAALFGLIISTFLPSASVFSKCGAYPGSGKAGCIWSIF